MTEEQRAFQKWVRRESMELAETDPMGSPVETDILETWKANRPKMVAELDRLGVTEQLAHVLWEKMYQTQNKLERAGMPPTDAREQATADWLMMEPEEPGEALPHNLISTYVGNR